jgi:hypothetical protein
VNDAPLVKVYIDAFFAAGYLQDARLLGARGEQKQIVQVDL